jgi:hypothetical protein
MRKQVVLFLFLSVFPIILTGEISSIALGWMVYLFIQASMRGLSLEDLKKGKK